MGAKKSPLPPVTIFGDPVEAEQDSRILVRRPYRRKVQSGYVPLWNEFFRCYRQVGVDPLAVYLWAYLRQHEYDRPQWTAVADVSWPGRRDLADTLGRGQEVISGLIQALRRAGLVWIQAVLPGFSDLAEAENLSVEQVQERAERVGVTPPFDGTLYRTADPLTRHEFALATQTQFCGSCKLYRRCEARIEAEARLTAQPALSTRLKKTRAKAVAQPNQEAVAALPNANEARNVHLDIGLAGTPAFVHATTPRVQIDTEARSYVETPPVSTQTQPQFPNRYESMQDSPTRITQTGKKPTRTLVVVAVQPEIQSPNANATPPTSDKTPAYAHAIIEHLVEFGFAHEGALHLYAAIAPQYQADENYVPRLIAYAQSHARTNPQGMLRRLIERGEDRQRPKSNNRPAVASIWQQIQLETVLDNQPQQTSADVQPAIPRATTEPLLPDNTASVSPLATFSEHICATMDVLSGKLGDSTHSSSNSVQALQMWQNSGLDETTFVAHMQNAYSRVSASATNGQSNSTQTMLFFFRLRQLLATAEHVRRETSS